MKEILGRIVAAELEERRKQGYDVEALRPLLGKASGSCDALLALSQRIKEAPIRQDWPYEEPDDLESVMAACDPTRRREASRLLSDGEIEARVRSAFLTSVCACILGKPLEEAPYGGLEDIRAAAQASGEWPLRDYVSDAMLTAWGRRNPSWVETTRGRVRYAASDDDITYTIMGMLLLEKRGKDFSHEDMRQLWLENLPIYLCWGPERTVLLRAGLAVLAPDLPYDMDDWAARLNPGQELCGAMIRADAYGYACPGDPELAARLAFRDASFTHRKTGVYSAMFVAAANKLIGKKAAILSLLRASLDIAFDTSALEAETEKLQEELMVASDLIQKCIYENAHVALDQREYQKRYDSLTARFDIAKARLEEIETIADKKSRRAAIEAFMDTLAQADLMDKFDPVLWCGLVDHVTVYSKDDVLFTFKNGQEIRA